MIMSILTTACEQKTRYEVLSFFFDGVPPPHSTEEKGDEELQGLRRKAGVDTQRSEHGPYAAEMCNACHRTGTNALLYPVEELCLFCHTFNLEQGWVHGPLASGGCRACHFPHDSTNPFLLVGESREFCLYCHSSEDIQKNEVHQGIELQCTDCHDAHISENKFLLK